MKATAIIPVKRWGAAKQRLLDRLDRPQRAAVVKAMLSDVLVAVSACEAVERIVVVTGEGRAERLALRHSQRTKTPLEILQEPTDRGHSEAATLGIVRALALGAECTVLLPGDCPLLDSTELDAAIGRMHPGGSSSSPTATARARTRSSSVPATRSGRRSAREAASATATAPSGPGTRPRLRRWARSASTSTRPMTSTRSPPSSPPARSELRRRRPRSPSSGSIASRGG